LKVIGTTSNYIKILRAVGLFGENFLVNAKYYGTHIWIRQTVNPTTIAIAMLCSMNVLSVVYFISFYKLVRHLEDSEYILNLVFS